MRAARGVLLTPGEPFFIRPGHADVVRLSIGGLAGHDPAAIAAMVASAALETAANRNTAMSV